MATVIVTGGAGFIGCNFVQTVLDWTRWRVVVVDKLTYAGSLLNLREVEHHPRFHFVRSDIADPTAMRDIINLFRPGAIVNFAAESHVDRSIDNPGNFINTNVVGTFELLEAARRFWISLPNVERGRFRFLHVSTDEVYGSLGDTGKFTEQSAYAPNSPYAASKAASDHIVRAYYQTYGLPTLVTNCSNNYGYYQFPEKLIPLTILNALAARPLPIYGDGQNVRDWLFVKEHCEGILAVLKAGRAGEHYNIGGDEERTNLSVVDEVCAALDEKYPAERNPALRSQGIESYSQLKTFVPDRPGHDRRYAIDSSKIAAELGWRPRVAFEEGIRATVEWYLNNREWCDAVVRGGYSGQRLGLSMNGDA